MKLKKIIALLEEFAPLSFQEDYDNSGLIYGNTDKEIDSALICLDITEETIDEAISNKDELIISHHPLLFDGIKKITGKNYVERCLIKAIQHDIAIYAIHTNLDNLKEGINFKICQKLDLINCNILQAKNSKLKKLVTFVPKKYAEKVRLAIFNAGAGKIGEYDCCSYNIEGTGTFRASDNTNPFTGEKNKLHFEEETRIETIFPDYLQNRIISEMIQSHPYEEVAYDIYPLDNKSELYGAGMIGDLKQEINEKDFLKTISLKLNTRCIRHTKLSGKNIKRVAVCGGSGSFLLSQAIKQKADIFISGDFKYHQFFNAENKIIIADIGHFESEQHSLEIIYELVKKKFPKFAARITKKNTNPINYYYNG